MWKKTVRSFFFLLSLLAGFNLTQAFTWWMFRFRHKSVVIICIFVFFFLAQHSVSPFCHLSTWCVITTDTDPHRHRLAANEPNAKKGRKINDAAHRRTRRKRPAKSVGSKFFPFFIPFIYYVLFAPFFLCVDIGFVLFFRRIRLPLLGHAFCWDCFSRLTCSIHKYTLFSEVNLNSSIIYIIIDKVERMGDEWRRIRNVFNNMETTGSSANDDDNNNNIIFRYIFMKH